jgi:hypothetical protein
VYQRTHEQLLGHLDAVAITCRSRSNKRRGVGHATGAAACAEDLAERIERLNVTAADLVVGDALYDMWWTLAWIPPGF